MKKYLLKICLCAVLVALLAGLGAAGAVFTDGILITYKTPVGVMHGAGILSGYTDGTFNPTGSITREEAVKMVTFAVLGEQGVMELPRKEPGFDDMSDTGWSAPYVSWAVENGIITGTGDGSFNPSGNVTGYQLAKMMLCAAGYGQKGEYSGLSWESTCAKDGFARGIFANITDADPSRSVTREEAALYIFNGITRIEQVRYDASAGKYVPKDGTATQDNTIAAQVYGIVDVAGHESVFRGIVSENLANGGTATVVDGRAFEYSSGLDLLGHHVVVYTNGASGLKNRIYYIGDDSVTVTLKNAVSTQRKFEEAFGEDFKLSAELTIYSAEAVLSEAESIEGLDPENFRAPAGSYVFYDGELISYMPPVPQKAALIDELDGETVTIGGEQYDISKVIGLEECKRGDAVLTQALAGRLFITPSRSYTGCLRRIEAENTYFFDGMVFVPTDAENLTGVVSVEDPQIGHYYTVFYDENYKYITIVNAL